MIRRFRTTLLLFLFAIGVTACAVRLGGPKPVVYDVVALHTEGMADASQAVQRLNEVGADLVLISTEQDSAWLETVATAAHLKVSGPGRSSGRALAFMSNLEVLGDTSLILQVPGGGSVHMHDALYKIDEDRNIDLMIVRFDAPDIRVALTRLLNYIATDVGASTALLLAVDGPTPAAADSVALLMRATLDSSVDCDGGSGRPTGELRLLYGPSARLNCLSARVLTGAPAGITARVQAER